MSKPVLEPDAMDWSTLRREAPEWFRDAKFGLFFHWGPYSVPAFENEWYSRNMYAKGLSQHMHHLETYGFLGEFGYKDVLPLWKADRFDPDEWADLIVRSGAKYAGPVTEHADNLSMWDSAVNPVNAVNFGPKRDVVGELRKSIHGRGLRFAATFHHQWLWGWFMSSDPDADVYDPANEMFYGPALPLETKRYIPFRLPDAEFNRVWAQKVIEVIDRYDPDLVYFDSRAAKQDGGRAPHVPFFSAPMVGVAAASQRRCLSFDRALQKGGDDLALKQYKDDQGRDEDEHRACAQQRNVGGIVPLKRTEGAGHRSLGRILDQNQGEKELIPGPDRHQDSQRCYRCSGERKMDSPEKRPRAGPVEPRRLGDIVGHVDEMSTHPEYAERHVQPDEGKDDREAGVVDTDKPFEVIERNDDPLEWQSQSKNEQKK